ncbi:MAG: protein-L-isoaspartate(D-aspartate) O-methyltransferase [Aquincola sp.]|nr:protein-L-isoaspartate(D-aspartate) O-methyltransferase [Aquincola sp.]MDH5329990.1 protein-L-isoaspartate(D-aspartate) O-methyltransferase [Aquincola sp.]
MSARSRRFPLPLARVGAHGVEAARRDLARARPTASADALPRGLGLDSQAVRDRMVARLRADGIRCEPVLAAMARVPRHAFVDAALVAQAYEDTALPIGHGQTISQPWVVARMIELLLERRHIAGGPGRVLEIGTGCGYQAALLACLGTSVISIERLRPLFDRAQAHLAPLRLSNLRLVYGDGRLGHAPNAPYDSIISAAGGEDVPEAWLQQLAVGGRLVAPIRHGAADTQVLVTMDRDASGWTRHHHEAVRFVPLRSGTA